MTRARLMAVIAAAALLAVAAPLAAAHPKRPTSLQQPLKDGCQRSAVPIGLARSPEWVYVYRSSKVRRATGISRVSHVSREDNPLVHRWIDFNSNLVPDRGSSWLVAGSRTKHTSNYADKGEEFARVHYEWESGTLPSFAWPTDGDRTTLWGSWIWDCGHWTSGAEGSSGQGKLTGEHSELHPLNAIVVNRHLPYLPKHREKQTDVFISNRGTAAHAEEKCALEHHPASDTTYDSGFYDCSLDPKNRRQPLLKRYHFFVPAPHRPSRHAKLRYRLVTRTHPSSGKTRIRRRPHGLDVTVTPSHKSGRVSYGKTFFVWWKGHRGPKATPLKIRFKTVLIRHSDPNPDVKDPSGAKWNLHVLVNGWTKLLNDWSPKLDSVRDGDRIKINRTARINVPRGGRVWFFVYGRECDVPNDTTVFNGALTAPLMRPCPPNRDEQNPTLLNILHNDDPGAILKIYRSAKAATGNHKARSRPKVKWPHSGTINFGSGTEGKGDYELTYSISRG